MADQKNKQQNNDPNRKSQQGEQNEQDSQTTRPNRKSETGNDSEQQAQPRRTEESGREPQNENVETGKTGTRRSEEGI